MLHFDIILYKKHKKLHLNKTNNKRNPINLQPTERLPVKKSVNKFEYAFIHLDL